MNAWVADQQAKGRTDAEIKANLAEYDEWDRYDFDGDGNFNEPDGYIDHFQLVHAGEDESAGRRRRGHQRHLGAPLVRVRHQRRCDRPHGQQGRWRPDRRHGHLGRRLHRPARERRPGCLRPRVRPRPRSPGPVRHLRRRRELGRLLVPDVGGLLARHRHGRDRQPAGRHDLVGQAPAWAGSTTTRPRPARPRCTSWVSRSTTPRTRRRSSSSCPRRPSPPPSSSPPRVRSSGGATWATTCRTP